MSSQTEKHLNQKQSPLHKSRKCQIHPECDYYFLYTDPRRNDVSFKCDFCIVKQSLDGKNLLPIDQVQKSGPNTVFYNWPFPQDYPFGERIQAAGNKEPDQNIMKNISNFFEDCKKDIVVRIESMQHQMEQKGRMFLEMNQKIMDDYNCISKKEEIRKIVNDQNSDIQSLSAAFKKIISDCYENQATQKESLKQKLDNMRQLESSISFQEANKLKENILNSIGKIEFFLIDPQNIASINEPKQGSGNVDYLLDLINNRFNFLSSPFLKGTQELLEKCRCMIDQINLGPSLLENQEKLDLSLLEEQEVNQITQLVKAIINQKKTLNQQNKNCWNAEKVYSLVSNNSNLCEQKDLDQLSKMLKGVNHYLECFEIDRDPVPIDWGGLDKEQLYGLGELGKMISIQNFQLITQKKDCIAPNMIFFENLKKIIEQLIETNYFTKEKEKQTNKLIVRYPLFQTVGTLLAQSTLPFLPSQSFYQSKRMKIESSNHNNDILITNTSHNSQQCFLRCPLKQNSNYIVRLSTNNIYDGNALFQFGLINQDNKDSQSVFDSDNIWYSQFKEGKVNKIIKGFNMQTGDKKKVGMKEYEIRMNIQNRIFQVCSPDKQNIAELDNKDYFIQTKQYVFAISLSNQADNVLVHEVKEVDKFDDFESLKFDFHKLRNLYL